MGKLFKLTGYKDYTIQRYVQGEYVDGEWVEGSFSEIEIQANIQPTKYSMIMQLPESDRSKKTCTVITEAPVLRAKKEGPNGYGGDRFLWQGDWFEVRQVKDWSDQKVLPHCESVAIRIELTPDEAPL